MSLAVDLTLVYAGGFLACLLWLLAAIRWPQLERVYGLRFLAWRAVWNDFARSMLTPREHRRARILSAVIVSAVVAGVVVAVELALRWLTA